MPYEKKIEVVYVDGLRVKLKNHLAYELTEPLTRDESEFSHLYRVREADGAI